MVDARACAGILISVVACLFVCLSVYKWKTAFDNKKRVAQKKPSLCPRTYIHTFMHAHKGAGLDRKARRSRKARRHRWATIRVSEAERYKPSKSVSYQLGLEFLQVSCKFAGRLEESSE
jgi:hypothetical protein